MTNRLRNRLTFMLERLLLRGPLWRILVIAVAIVLIAGVGGVLALIVGEPFRGVSEAVWWAFLRLTDPGYLGDDQGAWRRTISTALTILGYVVFLGALIAVMTQWLNQVIRDLERGLTPIVASGHVLILGWTDRTPTIVRELLLSEGRVRRFLRRQGTRSLRVVILAEDMGPALIQELRERLGDRWDGRRIIVRSGTPLRLEHLRRVDFLRAGVIVLPGADFGKRAPSAADHDGGEVTVADTVAVKTLLSIASHATGRSADPAPRIVAEIMDARKSAVVEGTYPGPVEVVPSDRIVSRLIVQTIRHPGLSYVITELLTHSRGNAIHIREHPSLAGTPASELGAHFGRAVVLGLIRREGRASVALLNPPPATRVEADDRIILLARHYPDTEIVEGGPPHPATMEADLVRPTPVPGRPRRVLVLGWSHRVPALVGELEALAVEHFEVDVVSSLSVVERERRLEQYGPAPSRVVVRHVEGDYTTPARLAAAAPASYDNILLLGSHWVETREESDARTILGYLLLRTMLPAEGGPEVLVELMDPANLALFRERPGEVLITPQIVSHMLAQVALRPDLGGVFDDLFGPEGAEILFQRAGRYGLAGREIGFESIQSASAARREIALGLRFARERDGPTGGIRLNPSRTARWSLEPDDEVIVLVTV